MLLRHEKKTVDPMAMYQPIEGKKYEFNIAPYQVVPVEKDAKVIKKYEEKYGVKINIWNTDNQKYVDIMNLKFASNEIPDYFRAVDPIDNWARQGVLAEVSPDVIKKFAPKIYEYSVKASPDVFRLGVVDGKNYGFCAIPISASLYRYSTCMWRGDWLEKVGIQKTPETLKEYEQAFYKFANEDPDGNGKKDTYGLSKSAFSLIDGAYGVDGFSDVWVTRDGKIQYASTLPEQKEVLALLNKWYKDGVIDPEFITGENTGGYWATSTAFNNSKIGFTAQASYAHWFKSQLPDGSFTYGRVRQELLNVNKEAEKKLISGLPPVGPKGISGSYTGGQSNVVIGNISYAFGSHLNKEPDKLGKLLQILDDMGYATEDNFLSQTYVIKGEDWTISAGTIVPMGKAKEDQNYIKQQGAVLFAMGPQEYPNSSLTMGCPI